MKFFVREFQLKQNCFEHRIETLISKLRVYVQFLLLFNWIKINAKECLSEKCTVIKRDMH
jgi:hypothetical protein